MTVDKEQLLAEFAAMSLQEQIAKVREEQVELMEGIQQILEFMTGDLQPAYKTPDSHKKAKAVATGRRGAIARAANVYGLPYEAWVAVCDWTQKYLPIESQLHHMVRSYDKENVRRAYLAWLETPEGFEWESRLGEPDEDPYSALAGRTG